MSQTGAPYCRLCETNHWQREPHNWKDVVKKVNKCVHKTKKTIAKPEEAYTNRQVGVRALRQGLAKELSDLPFDIIKNGQVIARVTKVD